MRQTRSFILAATFFAAASAINKRKRCPYIHWNEKYFDDCSSTIYNRTEVTNYSNSDIIPRNKDEVHLEWTEKMCVQTDFKCITVLEELQQKHINCWNSQRSIWFEQAIPGSRSNVSAVNITICRTKSTTLTCAFRFDNGTEGSWLNLFVQTKLQKLAFLPLPNCNCEFYWEYSKRQWRNCAERGNSLVLTILLIAGLVTLAIAGCIAFQIKCKKRSENAENVQTS